MSLVRRGRDRASDRDPCDSCHDCGWDFDKKRSSSPPKKKLLLDVIGSHRELTVIGHVHVIKYLPFVRQHNLILLEEYYRQPGNYSGRPGSSPDTTAKVIDYGNDYLALKLYDDLTRPELGEFLLNKGWDMIGYSTSKYEDSIFVMEKWTNNDDRDKR